MRSIKFDDIGHADPARPRLRPISRELAAVKPPEEMPEGSLTAIPAQRDVEPVPASVLPPKRPS